MNTWQVTMVTFYSWEHLLFEKPLHTNLIQSYSRNFGVKVLKLRY